MVAFLTEPREALRADTREPTECYTLSVTSTTWALGERIARDPVGEKGGKNLYAFVKNNALKKIDPLGLKKWFWSDNTPGERLREREEGNIIVRGGTTCYMKAHLDVDGSGDCCKTEARGMGSAYYWHCDDAAKGHEEGHVASCKSFFNALGGAAAGYETSNIKCKKANCYAEVVSLLQNVYLFGYLAQESNVDCQQGDDDACQKEQEYDQSLISWQQQVAGKLAECAGY